MMPLSSKRILPSFPAGEPVHRQAKTELIQGADSDRAHFHMVPEKL